MYGTFIERDSIEFINGFSREREIILYMNTVLKEDIDSSLVLKILQKIILSKQIVVTDFVRVV